MTVPPGIQLSGWFRTEFLAALREVLPTAPGEPICAHLNVGQSVTEPGVFVLSEAGKDLVELFMR